MFSQFAKSSTKFNGLFSHMTQRGFGMKKSLQLRKLLFDPQLEFIMEAHNGLSAKIVEEAGFKGIWASGLSISASLGVRDNNEASWTQVLEVIDFMSENTSIPILLDGDTGYGNFNNARRLIKKLEQRGIGGVCLEDKLFPKKNSFLDGETQGLADIEEFCGKIRACKDIQSDPDFVLVSRLEAFIIGKGLEEALKRAEAYYKAGTDAILCHSKKSDSSDIDDFMNNWPYKKECPVIIVPTKYWKTPTQKFRDLGVSMAIWANHNLRSTVKAMQETSKRIYSEQSLQSVEGANKIVSVNEIFRLQNVAELKVAEKKYETYNAQRPIDSWEERTFVDPKFFVNSLIDRGSRFFTGVPDSLLKDFCAYIHHNIPQDQHVIAANEGNAIGIAAGNYAATGNIPIVYMQNSGIGNSLNPILSLAHKEVYSVPMLLLIGWRGEPGKKDEPQHLVQGRCIKGLLETAGIPYDTLPDFDEGINECLNKAYAHMYNYKEPYALLVKKRTFLSYDLEKPLPNIEFPMLRRNALNMIVEKYPDSPIISTTGYTSRELYEIREERGQGHEKDFLSVGSMGHCSSFALGVAMGGQKEENIFCIDGDGSAIMHMGSMHVISKSKIKNLNHVVINNGMHDSVGGQPTGAHNIDFSCVAKCVGYSNTFTVETPEDLEKVLEEIRLKAGPNFIEIKVKSGTLPDLTRPKTTPHENIMSFIKNLRNPKKN